MIFSLSDIKKLLKNSKFNYEKQSWFFPSDLIPHNKQLRDSCKKLYELGALDRCKGSVGWMYKLKTN